MQTIFVFRKLLFCQYTHQAKKILADERVLWMENCNPKIAKMEELKLNLESLSTLVKAKQDPKALLSQNALKCLEKSRKLQKAAEGSAKMWEKQEKKSKYGKQPENVQIKI